MKTLKIKLLSLVSAAAFCIALALASPVYAASSCQSSGSPNAKANKTATSSEVQTCLTNNPITVRLNQVVNFLSAGVGIVVTGVIIVGGIQYTLAGDNATAVAAARQRITNGLIALLAFLFMWAFLQWLIPGGVFG